MQKTSQINGSTAYATLTPTEFDGLCFFDSSKLLSASSYKIYYQNLYSFFFKYSVFNS